MCERCLAKRWALSQQSGGADSQLLFFLHPLSFPRPAPEPPILGMSPVTKPSTLLRLFLYLEIGDNDNDNVGDNDDIPKLISSFNTVL